MGITSIHTVITLSVMQAIVSLAATNFDTCALLNPGGLLALSQGQAQTRAS